MEGRFPWHSGHERHGWRSETSTNWPLFEDAPRRGRSRSRSRSLADVRSPSPAPEEDEPDWSLELIEAERLEEYLHYQLEAERLEEDAEAYLRLLEFWEARDEAERFAEFLAEYELIALLIDALARLPQQ
jgi:hypothetical protein